MDLISMKRANGFLYAYRAGRFWVWNDGLHAWKESHLMAQKYALNHEADKLLTPEDFLTDPAVFSKQDVAELPKGIVGALERAQPCQNAPIEPVTQQETAVAPAVVQESMDTVAPSFDFGADDQTNALLLQDAQTFITGNMARIMAAKHAHDLTANHYKGSWGKWCAAVGISRDTGDNMVRVAEQFGNIQLEGKSILDVQPMKLLYAAAKPSTPETVKQAVFSGDITTYKEYQDVMAQLKAEKERTAAAEAREEEAWNMVSKAQSEAKAAQENLDHEISQNDALHEEKGRLLRECEAAKKARADAEDKASAAESQLEAATADVQGLAKENAKLHAEKEQAENRARKAEAAMKHQPITGVVDEEEVDRRAHQQAYSIAADMTEELKTEKAQLQKEVDALRKSSAQLERKMKAMTNQMDDLGQTDFDTANYFANAVLSLWNSCRGSYSRLTGEDLESTFQYICKALNDIREEAARLCRQPEGYEGGTEA